MRKSFLRRPYLPVGAVLCLVLMTGGISPAYAGAQLSVSSTIAEPSAIGALVARYDRYDHNFQASAGPSRGASDDPVGWPDVSPAAEAAHMRSLREFRAELNRIDLSRLRGEDLLNARTMGWYLDIALQKSAFDTQRIPFTSDEGFYEIPEDAADLTGVPDRAAGQRWIARVGALAPYYGQVVVNMQRGLGAGFTAPRLVAQKVCHTLRDMVATPPARDPMIGPIDRASMLSPSDRTALHARMIDELVTVVRPAQRRAADFLCGVYVPQSRATLGVGALPNGVAYYRFLIRQQTTTERTPDEIFALGQSEIVRIRKEMEAQAQQAGFKGDLHDFMQRMRADPQFYVGTREALLEKASRLAKRVDDQLPHLIGRLPRLTYGVRPVPRAIEEGYTSGRYNAGDPGLGVAGGLMINTSHLDQRPLYELPALVAHEGVPGHHIQIALSQELDGLPDYRRNSDITSYVEGWALYSEKLVREIGLYQTPYERFGALSMEMWRACRLVMDVGLHVKGWSWDQAASCLRDNTALTEQNIHNETDRYVGDPAQALAYKVGELTLLDLRHEAEAKLGPRFNERRFHDAVLDEGSMPMQILRAHIEDWIAHEK